MCTAGNVTGIYHHCFAIREYHKRTISAFCPDSRLCQIRCEKIQITVSAVRQRFFYTINHLFIVICNRIIISLLVSCRFFLQASSFRCQKILIIGCGSTDQNFLPLCLRSMINNRMKSLIFRKRSHINIFQADRQFHLLQCRTIMKRLRTDNAYSFRQFYIP